MEVILLERVEKLGQMGDTVQVKPGFARNYLLPQKKALRSNKENRAIFERQRAELELLNLKRREEAEGVAAQMAGVRVVLVRQASEGGQLYGSVTARDLQEALKEAGYKIERRQVELNSPIKSLGSYTVRLSLHPEVSIDVGVIIARSLAEAEELHAAEEFFEEPVEADDIEDEYEATEE